MRTTLQQPRRFEFGFPYLDATVLVEDYGDTVDIRASRNTFTEQRKISFVRELAAEGFIDESFRWFAVAGRDTYFGVHWSVDFSWLELSKVILDRARRFMVSLLVGGALLEGICLAGIWLGFCR